MAELKTRSIYASEEEFQFLKEQLAARRSKLDPDRELEEKINEVQAKIDSLKHYKSMAQVHEDNEEIKAMLREVLSYCREEE